ncbi:MAG: 50S ribosomal protein L11 methyltransferase [Armatimonadetes bacterium]|nr:50S ribosomal protein L11 methyltransferase [Armatimonadota bacterium]
MRWAEIVAAVSDESTDLVANIMIEEGCGGVAVTGPSVRASATAELIPQAPTPEWTRVACYLPVDDRLEGRLERIRERVRWLPETGIGVGPGEITVKWVEDADWENAWRSFFKPVEIGKVLVKPSWEDVEPGEGRVVVEIDPGMAFGTGNHPTTQLCLLALQKYVREGDRVLDVGAGSGILSIAAAKIGAREVIATEVDRLAVESARGNIHQNRLEHVVRVYETASPGDVAREVDLSVANIVSDTIIQLAPQLAGVIRPGGILIASGIVESRADEVITRLDMEGFEIVEKSKEDGWVVLVGSCQQSAIGFQQGPD